MVIVYGKIKDVNRIKKKINHLVRCPKCNKEIEIGIELEIVNRLNTLKNIYFPHIHLHGDPLHTLLCYISSDLKVRNIGVIESIEISRDANTFKQFLEKWMNSY